LDLPLLHCFGEQSGEEFFEALANADDLNLFNNRSIQTLIDYKWPVVRSYTIMRLFFPFIVY